MVAALREYVVKSNSDSPELLPLFTYRLNASAIETDRKAVGTVRADAAWDVMKRDLTDSLVADAARIEKAKGAFDRLVANGAVFGYDASQQSGCAAPTDFLLIIHPQAKTVFTIETTPCTK
jgi:hypothetical protein